MSWGVGARHLPRVVSYQQADKLEGTVVPIRGSGTNAGKKPAGSRKYPEITICRDAGGTIIVQGFESALIKYFPNGEVWIARDPYYQVTSNDIKGTGTYPYLKRERIWRVGKILGSY